MNRSTLASMPSLTELPLRDIHLPSPISWWPPALGWWILFAAFILILLMAIFFIWYYFKPTLKKQAKKQLCALENGLQRTGNASHCLSEISIFLRSTVLSQKDPMPPASLAGLTGVAWLTFLDQTLETPEFSQGVGKILLKGPYQPHAEQEDVIQLIQLCHKWVDRL